jgi:hypothetical protein
MPRAALARRYPALVADFQREYGLDLLGAESRMGAPRFLMLVSGLSPSSLVWSQQEPLAGEAAEKAFKEWG